MFYLIMNSGKPKFQRIVQIYILIFSCMLTYTGCMTTETKYATPDTFNSEFTGDISRIILGDGTQINCKGKTVKLERVSSSNGFIVITSSENVDSVKTGSDPYSYKTIRKEQKISLADVSKIQYEESQSDLGSSILTAGVIIGFGIFIVMLIASDSD